MGTTGQPPETQASDSPVLQRSDQRGGGQAAHWLWTRHSFSFADWFDPRHVQWGPLRVLNDDKVAPHNGFGFHSHRDMEIVTYILGGELRHRDSVGNDAVIRPGEAQRMSAGSGVTHSEWNDGEGQCRLLQVWIMPAREHLGQPPGYEQSRIPAGARESGWHVVAEGRAGKPRGEGTVRIHQDAALMATVLPAGGRRETALGPGRRGYVFIAEGAATVLGHRMEEGDSLRFVQAAAPGGVVEASSERGAHLLFFDLP